MKFLIVLCGIFLTTSAYDISDIYFGRIETCRGCSLNRLPQVKKFVFEDAPLYPRIDVNFIGGAVPELVLLGEEDKELERLPLSHLSRQDCNELVQSKGFLKKTSNKEL